MRYGTFRYGSAAYGASALTTLLWSIEVDWDGDGVFDGVNEAARCVGLSLSRGRKSKVASNGQGYEMVGVGRASLTLENADRRYDPWYPAGPLYGKLTPGKFVRIQVKVGSAGATYSIFTGILADLQPVSGNNPRVTLQVVDGVQWLIDNPASCLIQQNVSYPTAVGLVLDAVGWPAIWSRSLESAIAELPYWWADGQDARRAIAQLVDASLGMFFVAADGEAVFYTRNHISTPVAVADQDEINREILLPQPWEVIRNHIQVVAHPLQAQTSQTLWALGDKPTLAAGESMVVFANFRYSGAECPGINVVAPVAVTDYTANTASDGSGTNLTASFTVALEAFSKTAKLTITNGSGSVGYLTFLQVRGQPVADMGAVTLEAEDATSQAVYQKRRFLLDSPWLQNSNNADTLAKLMRTSLANPRYYPIVRLEDQPDLQFLPELFDAVTLNVPARDLVDDFRVGHIEHRWLDAGGQSIQTTWNLEAFENLNETAWVFPTRIGTQSYFGA